MNSSEHTELRRVIGLPHATAMVVGTIIGASIFVQPSEITGQIPSIAGVFFVWLVSGVLTLFGALVCAELASIYNRAGGVYVYLKEAFAPSIGFLWGWAMFWVMHSGIIAVIAVVFARYAGYFVPLGDTGIRLVAVGAILLLSAINYIGVKHGSNLQALFTLGKIVAIVLIIALGFIFGSGVPEHFVGPSSTATSITISDFLIALIAGLFAYGGWHMVTYNAEETVDATRTIPRALVLGTLIVTACYIAMNIVYLYILPLDTVATSTRVAADAADAVIGFGGGAVMSGLVMFSTFGALSGIVLSGPRVYFAMARDRLLFRSLGEIHPRHRTPHRSIAAQGVWSSVLVLTGSYRELFTRVIYTEWIFFGLMAVGLFVLRGRDGVVRQYNVWGFPVVPALFALSAFAIVLNQIVANTRDSILGLSLVLLGLPVYFFWTRRGSSGTSQ